MARINEDEEWRVNLLPTMNSRDRVNKENILFMFDASNSSWRIIMKARITIKDIKEIMKK